MNLSNRLRRYLVNLGNDKDVGPRKMLQRFAQDASRQDVAISKGIGSIDEDDVDVAIKLPVLEAVVEDENLSIEFFNGHAAAYSSVPTDENGNAHEASGHETRFIAPLFSRKEYHAAIGHDRSAALLPFRVIASVEEGDAPTPGRKFFSQHTGHRRLPRPADGNITKLMTTAGSRSCRSS